MQDQQQTPPAPAFNISPQQVIRVINSIMPLISQAVSLQLPLEEARLEGGLRLWIENRQVGEVPQTFVKVAFYKWDEQGNETGYVESLYDAELTQGIKDALELFKKSGGMMFGMVMGMANMMGLALDDKITVFVPKITEYIELLKQWGNSEKVLIQIRSYKGQALVNVYGKDAKDKSVILNIEGKPANYWLADLSNMVIELLEKQPQKTSPSQA